MSIGGGGCGVVFVIASRLVHLFCCCHFIHSFIIFTACSPVLLLYYTHLPLAASQTLFAVRCNIIKCGEATMENQREALNFRRRVSHLHVVDVKEFYFYLLVFCEYVRTYMLKIVSE